MKFRPVAVALALLSFLCLSLSPATRADKAMAGKGKPMHGHMMMMHGKTMRHHRHHKRHGMTKCCKHGCPMMKKGAPMHKMDNKMKM